ncbi:Cytochrome P450 4C1 [Chionoecetes opilio]|uniref:Cytochrome P450 4C1 n=1 Tax=Chionoecetes opilio TaxID=41210 RepID=A0A8J4Y3L8_CHIOP|nr:Cytochrome P450 4C1 [Chionoecetes opilio]
MGAFTFTLPYLPPLTPSIGALVQLRQTRPWIQPEILFRLFGYAKQHDEYLRILHHFSYSAIDGRRKEYEAAKLKAKETAMEEEEVIGKKRRLAFLDLLLNYSETQTALSNEDIREEVDTFMFEGHDTTAAAINWTLYLLGCHPEIQVGSLLLTYRG